MGQNKQNDWIATLLFQPDVTLHDLQNNDITPDNTTIQDREWYKSKDQIKQAFSDEKGNFNDVEFEKYYESALTMYNDFSKTIFMDNALNTDYEKFAEFGFEDIGFAVTKSDKKTHTGISGLGITKEEGDALSDREYGQGNNVWNYSEQKWETWTPEDMGGLFKGLVRPTLVLAQYEEDFYDENTGITHAKGSYKLNSDGETFYETLDGRDIVGKEVLRYSDTLTREESAWNKIDFYDSDGIHKSIGGTIMKAIANIVPYVIPQTRMLWSAVNVVTELGTAIPNLAKSINAVAGGDSNNVKLAKSIESFSSRFKSTESDNSRERMVTFENLGNMISQISGQLYQQKLVGSLPKLAGSENRTLGRNLALGYMAATSSQETYNEFIKAGASEKVAGWGAISSLGAMYGLMNMNYFRNSLFKNSWLDETEIKGITKAIAKSAIDKNNLGKVTNLGAKEGANFITKTQNKIKDKWLEFANNANSTNIQTAKQSLMQSSISEALEETSEELVFDFVKGVNLGLNALGVNMTKDPNSKLDFGYSAEDALQRYAMSFFGGAIGGPIFRLHGIIDKRIQGVNDRINLSGNDGLVQDFVYHIRQGKENEIKDYIKHLWKKGKLGDVNLSGLEYELIDRGGEASIKYLPANIGESQNDLVYKQLVSYVDSIVSTIKLTENAVQNDSVMSVINPDYKKSDIIEKYLLEQKNSNNNKTEYDAISEMIVREGLANKMYNDLDSLTTKILTINSQIRELNSNLNESNKDSTEVKLGELNKELKEVVDRRNSIIKGESNDYYYGESVFILDSNLHKPFIDISINDYAISKYGRSFNALDEGVQNSLKNSYDSYKGLDFSEKVSDAYDIFLGINKFISPDLNKLDLNGNAESIHEKNLQNAKNIEKSIYDQIFKGLNISEFENVTISENLAAVPNSDYSAYGNLYLEELWNSVNNSNLDDVSKSVILERVNNLNNIFNEYSSHSSPSIYFTDSDKSLNGIINNINSISDYYKTSSSDFYSYSGNSDLIYLLNNWNYDNVNSIELKTVEYAMNGIIDNIKNGNYKQAANDAKYLLDDYELSEKLASAIENYENSVKGLNSYTVSPLLENIVISLGGKKFTTLLNLLQSNENRFNKELSKTYVIDNPDAEQELIKFQEYINILATVINSAKENNFNGYVNDQNGDISLATISEYTANILLNDLVKIEFKLKNLLRISKENQNKRLTINQDIEINMRKLFTSSLSDRIDKINGIFNTELKPIDVKSFNRESYGETLRSVIDFETDFYRQIRSKGYSSDQIINNLIEALDVSDKDLINQESPRMSTSEIVLSKYGMLVHAATILTVSSDAYLDKLSKMSLSDEFEDKALIFPQEYDVRISYSKFKDSSLYDSIVKSIHNVAKKDKDSAYVRSLVPSDIIFMPGYGGTGKTSGVLLLLKLMSEDNENNVSLLAPTKKRVNKFAEDVKIDKNNAFSKKEFFEKLGINLEDITYSLDEKNNFIILSEKSKQIIEKAKSKFVFSKSGIGKILLIDEITLFSEPELSIISSILNGNSFIATVGDTSQVAAKVSVEHKGDVVEKYSGIEELIAIQTPSLTMSLRSGNLAEIENNSTINRINDVVHYGRTPYDDSGKVSEKVNSELKFNHEFVYYESDTNFFGKKLIDDSQIQEYVNKFSSYGDVKIAIITSHDTLKYTGLIQGNPKVEVIHIDNVQGDEFDYVIGDVDLTDGDAVHKMRVLTMLLTRNKIGAVYIPNGINGSSFYNNFEFIESAEHSIDIQLNTNQISEFKEWSKSGIEFALKDRIISEEISFQNEYIKYSDEKIEESLNEDNDQSQKSNELQESNELSEESKEELIIENMPLSQIDENDNPFKEYEDSSFVSNDQKAIEGDNSESFQISKIPTKVKINNNSSDSYETKRWSWKSFLNPDSNVSLILNDIRGDFPNNKENSLFKFLSNRNIEITDEEYSSLVNLFRSAIYRSNQYRNINEELRNKVRSDFNNSVYTEINNIIKLLESDNYSFIVESLGGIDSNGKILYISLNVEGFEMKIPIENGVELDHRKFDKNEISFNLKGSPFIEKSSGNSMVKLEDYVSRINVIASKPFVLVIPDDYVPSNDRNNKFIQYNNGKSMVLLTDDPFYNDGKFESQKESNDDIMNNTNTALAGVQIKESASNVFQLALEIHNNLQLRRNNILQTVKDEEKASVKTRLAKEGYMSEIISRTTFVSILKKIMDLDTNGDIVKNFVSSNSLAIRKNGKIILEIPKTGTESSKLKELATQLNNIEANSKIDILIKGKDEWFPINTNHALSLFARIPNSDTGEIVYDNDLLIKTSNLLDSDGIWINLINSSSVLLPTNYTSNAVISPHMSGKLSEEYMIDNPAFVPSSFEITVNKSLDNETPEILSTDNDIDENVVITQELLNKIESSLEKNNNHENYFEAISILLDVSIDKTTISELESKLISNEVKGDLVDSMLNPIKTIC